MIDHLSSGYYVLRFLKAVQGTERVEFIRNNSRFLIKTLPTSTWGRDWNRHKIAYNCRGNCYLLDREIEADACDGGNGHLRGRVQ